MPTVPDPDEARHGYSSDFETFPYDNVDRIVGYLSSFVRDVSPEQLRAWRESVPDLQAEAAEIVVREGNGETYTAVLEYEMPMEQRRADVIFLVGGAVVVLELKGASHAIMACRQRITQRCCILGTNLRYQHYLFCFSDDARN